MVTKSLDLFKSWSISLDTPESWLVRNPHVEYLKKINLFDTLEQSEKDSWAAKRLKIIEHKIEQCVQ